MSIWSDMQDRSAGTTVKKEDKIRSKEALSYLIIEKLKEDKRGLERILESFSKRLDLPDKEEDSLFDI